MNIRRSTKVAVGIAAAALGLSAGPALAAVQPAGTTWTSTGTIATALANATSLGSAPATRAVPVTVTLATRNEAGLRGLIADQANPASASYHRYLTPAQFTARFGATPAQVAKVTSYLRSEGLTNLRVSANRLTVSADATAATASRAFNTKLGLYRQAGRTVVANTSSAQVPSGLGGLVAGVVGLNQAHVATPQARPMGLVGSSAFTPPQLAQVYDASGMPAASGTSIAIMAEGDLTGTVNDLRQEEKANGLPQVPVTIVPTGAASTDTSGADEWDLDSQTSTAMAGNVSMLYLYDAPSLNDPDIVTEIQDFVTQDKAMAGSASFGECDSDAVSDGTAKAVDAAVQEGLAQGQSLFASSGDTGSSCSSGGTLGLLGLGGGTETSFPASGTWTTGVGGTTLTAGANETYGSETAWNEGGGGLSNETAPSWQTADVAAAPKASVNPLSALLGSLTGATASTSGSRGVPDIAMDADPNTGANIVVNGTVETVGGTSLASPLALGAWARIQQAHGGSLGDAAQDLYAHTAGIHDVTSGSNGAYSAAKGYDLTTGLGTLDVAKVSASL